jgi:hypothetical protein
MKWLNRIFASFLAFLLVFQASFPNPAGAALITGGTALTPSPRIAVLTASTAKSGALPQVILIQDLHFNYSVQKHIAQLLGYLAGKKALGPMVAVEGAAGPVDNSLLSNIQNDKVRAEISDFLLQNGELTGSQLYSATSRQPRILQGIEDPAYFKANRELFRTSYALRQQAARQIARVSSGLKTLIPVTCSRSVRNLRRWTAAFESGEISVDLYWAKINVAGERAGVPVPSSLAEFLSANFERRGELLLSGDVYQALRDYVVDVEAAMARTPQEKNLVRLVNELDLAERALRQHATFDEIRHVAGRVDRLAELLEVFSRSQPDRFKLDAGQLREALRACTDFYVAALMRNKPILENTLKLRAANGAKPTSLIVGGFHTAYITRELSQRGISFAVYSPQVDRHNAEDEDLYDTRLLGERLTQSEALEWLAARGGIRGSPSRASLLASLPDPSELSWLPSWIKAADNSESFYNRKLIESLRHNYRVEFPNRFESSTDDLTNGLFDHEELLPGGRELRAVLSMFRDAGVEMPIKSLVALIGDEIILRDKKDRLALAQRRELSEHDLQGMLELVGSALYIQRDAVISHPGFEQGRKFEFWLMVILHEMAHFEGIRHSQLAAMGLDEHYDLTMSAQEIVGRYAEILPEIGAKLLDRSAIESILAISGPAFRRMEEQNLPNVADLSATDIAAISDFAEHTRLKPLDDYRPAEKADFYVLPDTLEPSEMEEARRMEADGSIVDEIFAGGAASRIRGFLNLMVELRLLTERESRLLWNTRLRDFPKALDQHLKRIRARVPDDAKQRLDNVYRRLDDDIRKLDPELTFEDLLKLEDWGSWGTRVMLALNAYTRRQARAGGFNEEAALQSKRILFHVAKEDLQGMVADFEHHQNYGFGEILFVVNYQGPLIYGNAQFNSFMVADPDAPVRIGDVTQKLGKIVYGHGPATVALGQQDAAYILKRGGSLEPLAIGNSRISAGHYLLLNYANRPGWSIREHRLNDLGLLTMDEKDTRLQAYFNRLRNNPKNACYVLFQMVLNPSQILVNLNKTDEGESLSIESPQQAGGRSFVFKADDGTTRVVPVETGATGGQTAEMSKDYGGNAANEYLNSMRTIKDGQHWIQAILAQGLTYFYGVHKSPVDNVPLKLTRADGILLKPQTATGHLALWPELGAQAVIYPEQDPRGTLNDLKTQDGKQVVASVKVALNQDRDPLVLALAQKLGKDIRRLDQGEMAVKIQEELDRIDAAELKKGHLQSRHAHIFAAAAAAAVLLGFLASPIVALAAGAWGVAALGQEYAVAKSAVMGHSLSEPVAAYDFTSQRMKLTVDSIPARAEELAHALTQSQSEVVTRLFAPLTLVLAIVDAVVGRLIGIVDWLTQKVSGNPPPDLPILQTLNAHAAEISALLERSKDASFSTASRAWDRVRAGMFAVWSNSQIAAAEAAARRELSTAA